MSRGLLTIMATVTHLGLVVLTVGFVSFAWNRDVIVEQDAGTLLGPAMVLAAMAVVFLTVARCFGVAERDGVTPRILQPAVVAAAVTFVAMLLVGGGIYALERREAVWLVLFAGRYADSAFVVVTAVWAAVVVAGALLLARHEAAADASSGAHDEL
jgi:hypothetical protein